MSGKVALRVAALAALAACQAAPTGPVSLPLADASSMRVFQLQTNADWTSHIPLFTGSSARLKVRLYTAGGQEITPQQHPLDMSFSIAPATLATATVADSALLLFDISPNDPAGSDGSLHITLTEPATATTKSFGPFYILVHP